jgi:hypothetical protein
VANFKIFILARKFILFIFQFLGLRYERKDRWKIVKEKESFWFDTFWP